VAYDEAGQHDFLHHVGVRDANHLRDLAMDTLTSSREDERVPKAHERLPKADDRLPSADQPRRDGRRGRG
jgi:hypothetical protein